MTEKQNDKYEMIAESPFLHNVAYKEWGMPEASDYSSLMWMPIWGTDTFGVLEDHPGWFIKPLGVPHILKDKCSVDRTAIPLHRLGTKVRKTMGAPYFLLRWYRSFTEMYPDPMSMARPFEGGGGAAVNLLAKKYGAILHKVRNFEVQHAVIRLRRSVPRRNLANCTPINDHSP